MVAMVICLVESKEGDRIIVYDGETEPEVQTEYRINKKKSRRFRRDNGEDWVERKVKKNR